MRIPMFVRLWSVLVCVVAVVAIAQPVDADSLNVVAYSAVAQSTCATSGPAPNHPLLAYTVPYAPGCPGQDLHADSGVVGPISASSSGSVTGAISSFSPPWSESGLSQAIADYGVLRTMAMGSLDGATDGFSWHGHEAWAGFSKTLTMTSGVSLDIARFKFTVDGTLTGDGLGDGQFLLTAANSNQVGETLGFRLQYGISNVTAYLNGGYVTSAPGLATLTNGFAATGVDVFFDVPFASTVAFDFSVLMSSVALPGPSPSPSDPPSAYSSSFLSTARLTGISVLSGTDFVIDSGSGAVFTKDGVLPAPSADPAVPEPATLGLVGLGALAAAVRRRRRNSAGIRPSSDYL
jgi:hypothetical protein